MADVGEIIWHGDNNQEKETHHEDNEDCNHERTIRVDAWSGYCQDCGRLLELEHKEEW